MSGVEKEGVKNPQYENMEVALSHLKFFILQSHGTF